MRTHGFGMTAEVVRDDMNLPESLYRITHSTGAKNVREPRSLKLQILNYESKFSCRAVSVLQYGLWLKFNRRRTG